MINNPIEVRTVGPKLLCLALDALVATVSPIFMDTVPTNNVAESTSPSRRRGTAAGPALVVVLLVGENWQGRVAAEARQQRRSLSLGISDSDAPRYALVADGNKIDFYGARKMAVNAFIGTDEPASVLVQGVQAAAQNRLYCSPQLLPALIDAVGTNRNEVLLDPSADDSPLLIDEGKVPPVIGDAPAAQAALLSSREHEVALHAARGLSNEQIAVFLGISVPTVKFHLMHAFRKLGIQRRSQLYIYMPYLTSATEALLPTVGR